MTLLHYAPQVILGLCLLSSLAYYVLALAGALRWRRGWPRPGVEAPLPAITVLKPVRGADPDQLANFETFCRQDYPEYQILFGALDPADLGLEAAHRLAAEHSSVDIGVVSGGEAFGLNRKACNLHQMLPSARHELLVLCDSDMRVDPDYLRRLAAPFADPAVGLVTCLYRGYAARGLASRLEAVGIGADFAPSVLAANLLEGMSFAMGSTIAVRRSALEAMGGFAAVADALADDYLLGNGVKRAGYEVVLSDYVVDDVLGREPFGAMWSRRLRWARTMRVMRTAGWAGAFVTYAFALGLAFLAATGFRPLGWAVLGGLMAARIAVAIVVATACTRDFELLRNLWLLPISDLLAFALWLGSFLGSGVSWRGESFTVMRDGRLRPRRAAPESEH